jgi:hypothetical protein
MRFHLAVHTLDRVLECSLTVWRGKKQAFSASSTTASLPSGGVGDRRHWALLGIVLAGGAVKA